MGWMASEKEATTGSSTLPLMNFCCEYMRKSSMRMQLLRLVRSWKPILQAQRYPSPPEPSEAEAVTMQRCSQLLRLQGLPVTGSLGCGCMSGWTARMALGSLPCWDMR